MLHLHVPPRLSHFGQFFAESDHTAWVVLLVAVVTGALIVAAFLMK
jgi:uncharacterized integral membrane protein